MTAELLGLRSPGIRNQKGTVIGNQLLLQLHCAVRVEVLRVVGNNRLRDRLADSVHLRRVSTTLYTYTDVDRLESILTSDEDRFVYLETEDLGLEEVDW